jgi:nucleoside-diphosphate-sugar epimerase
MKRVLVTGATGFIGRHTLQPLLDKGYEVHAVRSPRQHLSTISTQSVSFYSANLLNPAEVSHLLSDLKPTHLLHLAWYVEHEKFWSAPENFRWVEASLHLLQTFSANGGRRVVVAGTCMEYDLSDGLCDEISTFLQPTTPYSICKHALHLLVNSYAAQVGLSAGWGRLFFLYGPYEKPARLVASVARNLLLEQSASVSHGEQTRDFLHVVDAADAFVALLDCDVEGAVNIASGQPVRLKDLIDMIAFQVGKPELVEWGALTMRSDDPPRIVARIDRLRNMVGWSPSYDLEHGIETTLDWWKRHLNDPNITMPGL